MNIDETKEVNSVLDRIVKKMISHTDNHKMTWWGLDNSFNSIRKQFTIKPFSEALSDTKFDLRTNGLNDDIAFFDKRDLKILNSIQHNHPTVKYVMDGEKSYVPCDLKTAQKFTKKINQPKYIGV